MEVDGELGATDEELPAAMFPGLLPTLWQSAFEMPSE